MLTIFAELSKEGLEYIYELTYKYGWLTAVEREEHWLPDKAYLAKAKIEGEFKPVIDDAMEEIENAYTVWLDFHEKDGWVRSMHDLFLETSLHDLLWQLGQWDITPDFYKIVVDALGGSRAYLEKEDPEYLAETYGEQFIEDKLQMDIYDLPEDKSVTDFIIIKDLNNDLIDWLINDVGWTLEDHLSDMYSVDDFDEAYSGIIEGNVEEILEQAYPQYLNRFPGLGDEIEEIRRVKDEVIDPAEDAPLSDQIVAFQIALTTAHHHGDMADHIMDVPVGTGKAILDRLSSDENVEKWNKDLRQMGIKIE